MKSPALATVRGFLLLLNQLSELERFRGERMTLDECESVFKEALACSTESQFCNVIEPLFDFYEILSLGLGRGSIYWRARVVEDRPYSNIMDLDYPPAELVKAGRLNDLGVPCFYISTAKETAISEVHAREGDVVQIAGFRIKSDQIVRLAVVGEYSNVQRTGYVSLGGNDPDLTISKYLNQMPQEQALLMLYIDRFFAHILADPKASESDYRFSRALGDSIYGKCAADGIAFPSVRDRGGFNMAIKAIPSDSAFHNVACVLANVGRSRMFGMVEFDVFRSAQRLDSDDNFIWMPECSSTIGIYGLTKEEFEKSRGASGSSATLLDLVHGGS